MGIFKRLKRLFYTFYYLIFLSFILVGNSICATRIHGGVDYNWCVIIRSDGNINVKQGGFNLGWCNNNNGCQEIYEGDCGFQNRVTDAQCAQWAVSQGDDCGSIKLYSYFYFMCGYSWNSGNVLWQVVESPTCVYRLYWTIDCSGTASSGFNYVHSCPPYNLESGQSSTCTLKNEYNSNLNVTVTGCSGVAAYVGDTQLLASVNGMTVNYNDNYCSTGSEISSIIIPTGTALTLTQSCKSGSCSGRYQVGVTKAYVYPDASSWITVPGQFHYGNDLQYFSGQTSKESCINNCKSTNGCVGASYKSSNGDCYVHSAITDIRASPDFVLLLPPFLSVPYLIIVGLDADLNDITSYSGLSKAQCMTNCEMLSNCVAVQFHSNNNCYLKHTIANTVKGDDYTLLVYPGAVIPGVNFYGNDLTNGYYGAGNVLLLSLTLLL